MSELGNNDLNENSENPSSIILSEAEFSNALLRREAIERLVQSDTRSQERELVRPRIGILRTIANIIIPLGVWFGIFCALYFLLPNNRLAIALGVSFGALGIYILVRLRAILIWSIKVYQRFAPAEVRLRCVFTPSCSEYAICALERYGVLRGVPKIISRLRRCHPPNGGDDPLT